MSFSSAFFTFSSRAVLDGYAYNQIVKAYQNYQRALYSHDCIDHFRVTVPLMIKAMGRLITAVLYQKNSSTFFLRKISQRLDRLSKDYPAFADANSAFLGNLRAIVQNSEQAKEHVPQVIYGR